MAALLLLAAVTGLNGCRKAEGGAVDAVVIAERPPKLADPLAADLAPADLLLVGNVAQGLVRFDAAGDIAPGLAERWAVSDDGLSYVFRLRTASWSDGRKVRARDVVRLIERQLDRRSRNPLFDTIGAVREVVAMTDRVIAVELNAPRPHLLQLLAQPEFGLVRGGGGTGPFTDSTEGGAIDLVRTLPGFDGDEAQQQRVRLTAAPAQRAIESFVGGDSELVLGGTVADFPLASAAKLPRNTLRIDPVLGLFGLVPARDEGPAADLETRALLDEAIDRDALVAALAVPGLQPRLSLLQPGLDLADGPALPAWAPLTLEQRRPDLLVRAREIFPLASGSQPPPTLEPRKTISLALPDGPGGAIILARLKADWEPLGVQVVEAGDGPADFRFIDEVAPSSSPAWFLRRFRCEFTAICSEQADQLLDAARLTGFPPQRARFFVDAERIMREEVLFLPIAAPVRWSLAGRDVQGFAENRFGRHTLTDLRMAPNARD
ncbi:ABC transporter substrate-binding protein [Sphingomonas glaciei]|uniref:ABC transporter substrate-binding protein n=1 Tax=Sphingomonas glaciei TaxID=2938948 RepID=A0ABY5MTS2_9SPHN|nr:ABC transporter substrate-binding protein [Sphingomonas glaciei]UUR07903.1 ABC transporter substrate-binding protein [Sphingomonas glaciei]